MSTTTEKLSLFKYDTTADAKQPFSITNCMNNNWDKIDAFAKSVDTVFASDFSSQLDKKVFKDINDKLGQKLEAEVLLAENGYIKFNNGVILSWIFSQGHCTTITLPIAYSNLTYIVCGPFWIDGIIGIDLTRTISTITVACVVRHGWPVGGYLTIGY